MRQVTGVLIKEFQKKNEDTRVSLKWDVPLDYEYQKFLMKRQEEVLILSMSQLNLGEDERPQVDEDGYNTDEENDIEAQ